jgi:hypothetical protein
VRAREVEGGWKRETGIDAVTKQKNAEYCKRYRLKCKLLYNSKLQHLWKWELVQKQQKAEYAKQYRLERKLLMQQQASTSSETESVPNKRRHDGANEEDDDEIFDFVVMQPNKNNKRIPSTFNDESTGSFICLRRHIYMSHVNIVQPIRIKMICDMYMCHIRHINDPVLSSLKVEGIRLFFIVLC